jgi:hypothetical protein
MLPALGQDGDSSLDMPLGFETGHLTTGSAAYESLLRYWTLEIEC